MQREEARQQQELSFRAEQLREQQERKFAIEKQVDILNYKNLYFVFVFSLFTKLMKTKLTYFLNYKRKS